MLSKSVTFLDYWLSQVVQQHIADEAEILVLDIQRIFLRINWWKSTGWGLTRGRTGSAWWIKQTGRVLKITHQCELVPNVSWNWILKIGPHLPKLLSNTKGHTFRDTSVFMHSLQRRHVEPVVPLSIPLSFLLCRCVECQHGLALRSGEFITNAHLRRYQMTASGLYFSSFETLFDDEGTETFLSC